MNTDLGDLTVALINAIDEGTPTDRIVTKIGEAVIDARLLMGGGHDPGGTLDR